MSSLALDPLGFITGHAPKVAAGVLGVGIAVQLALLVTNFLANPATSGPAATDVVAPPTSSRPALDVVALMNAHLFGQAAASPVDARTAPATSMSLVLAGTIAADDPRKGFALIGDTAANARVYAAGAALPSGVRLHEVYRDRVIIDRGGALEALLLPRQAMSAGAPPPVSQTSAAPSPLLAAQQVIERNPDALNNIVRAQPVIVEGKARGVRVFPGSNSADFSRLGLRPGDLVTSINGTPLDDPNRAVEIFNTLQSLPEARVGVVRNGRPTEITVNMTEVTRQAETIVGTEGMTPASALPATGPDREP